MDENRLTDVIEKILQQAIILDKYSTTHALPAPSFDCETFIDLPVEVEIARNAVVDLAQDLKRLAQGPRDLLFDLLNKVCFSFASA